MANPKIKNTITKKEWNKKHKDFKLMGKDGIPYIMAYDDKIGTHLVPVKIIEATDAEEMEESVGAELDLIKQSSKDVKDFLKNVFKDSDFRAMKSDKDFIKYLKSIYEGVSVNESVFSFKTDKVEQLHFETNPKKAELMKIELGKMQGEINKRKQIEGGEYSLRLFRNKIKYGNGKDVGVFLPGSYDAATSKLGDGPHKKAVKKVNWNQTKYDQWLEDMASNGGAKNAFDMAQNAKNEPGLIDWVKKNFRGDKPLQRIQWDIEGFSESVNEGISVSDERHFGKKGIIIMIDDNGKKVSAIFKDKKNADKFNRNNPSDIKKLLDLAKKTKYPNAIDESVVNEFNTSVNKRRAGAELKQKLKGKRSDGMGKYTATIYGLDSNGKRVELKSLNDLNKYSKFELGESVVTEGKDEVTPKQLANLQRDIKKINPKIKVYISNHPITKGKLQIELGSDHPSNQGDDREITKINTLLKKHTGDWRTGTMFTESINEAKEDDVITQLRKIVKDKQNSLVVDTKSKKKVRVDMQSASLMVQVYDALKQQSNKDKFVKSGIVAMGHMAYKLMKNEGVNEGKAFVVMFKDKKDLPNRNVKPSSAAYSKEVDAKKFLKSVENDGGKGMIVKSNVSGMKVEAKDAEVYHKSYTHAIEAAEAYALKKGYTIEDDEMFNKVGMNSKRPSVGKTTKVNLELLRNGKPQKKMLHIQVYGMKNGYELNAYIN